MKLARLWLLAVLLLHGAAYAAAPHIEAHVAGARLAGEGDFRWFGLKIYDAQLWVGKDGYQAGNSPFALELRYARTLYGAKIAESSRDEIRKLGLGSESEQAAWLAAMRKLFPDVQEGSKITGVYLPAKGARFYFDGKALGEIADPQFARAFFAIWLDPKTSAPALRAALLREAAARP